jgi:hypothetical protein
MEHQTKGDMQMVWDSAWRYAVRFSVLWASVWPAGAAQSQVLQPLLHQYPSIRLCGSHVV